MQRPVLKQGDARVRPLPLRDLLASTQEPAEPVVQAPCETRVEPLMQGGVVVALEVHCACGEVTRVSLDYTAASGPEAA